MGLETVAAIAIGSQLIGQGISYFENRAARRRAASAADQLMQPGSYDSQLLNRGQDSFLQYMRSNPDALRPFQFDYSKAFQDLQARDRYTINDQVAQLGSGVRSLGERFGSGFASREAMLRSRFAADISARNAGIAQNSFNNALNAGLAGFSQQQQYLINLAQLEQQRRLAAAGIKTGIPASNVGQQIGQTGSDITQLMLLLKYLNPTQQVATNTIPTTGTPTVVPYGGNWQGGYNL